MLRSKSPDTLSLAKVLGLLFCCASALAFNTYRPANRLQRPVSRNACMPRGSPALPQTRLFQAGTSNLATDDGRLLTMEEVEDCARAFDLELRLSTLGPFYRVVAKNVRDGEAVGYSSGFVAPPLGVIHLDTMQVRQKYWKQLDGPQRFRYGCGVLLGAAVMCHARSQGCLRAELLAINDDDRTHNRLKAFYALAGFRVVKEVTSELQHLPDLLLWGGVGTRMDAQVEGFLRKWAPLIRSRGERFMAEP